MSGTRHNTRSAIDGNTPSGDAGDARAPLNADRTVVLSACTSSREACETVMQLLTQVRGLLPGLNAEDGGTVSTELSTLQLALGQQPVMRLCFDEAAASSSAAPAQPDADDDGNSVGSLADQPDDDGSEAGSECSQASSRCLATLVPPLP